MTGVLDAAGRCMSGESEDLVVPPDTPTHARPGFWWVDVQEAIGQLRGDVQGFREICGIFLQESSRWQAQLPELAAKDRPGFVAVLHEVTNALPIVGARAAAQSLRRMEFALRDDDRLPAEPALRAALDIIAAVHDALRQQITQRGA